MALENALNKRRCRFLVTGSLAVLILIEAFSALLNAETIAGRWFDIESPLWQALTLSEAFPVNPLFLFSAGATGLALIALLRLLPHQPVTASSRPGPLVAFGRMSLTMYIAHILCGHAYHQWIISQYGIAASRHTLFFAIGFSLAGIVFASVWARFFMRGPLEFVMNTMAHTLASPVKPAWSLRT